MGLFTASGTRLTRASITTSADPDPILTITQDVWEQVPLIHERGPDTGEAALTEGSQHKLKWKAGFKIRTSELDRQFPPTTVTSVTPATGAVAGGTVVTIKGTYLNEASTFTIGGVATTGLVRVSPSEVRVTTGAHAAGAVAVAGAASGGAYTKANAFTYV